LSKSFVTIALLFFELLKKVWAAGEKGPSPPVLIGLTTFGSLITTDARCKKGVRKRIVFAKEKFQVIRPIFTNRNLCMKLEIRLLQCYI